MIKSISFYHNNIDPAIIEAQKSVFDHFGMEHEQTLTTLTHGAAIDDYLLNKEWNEVAIFDIDCIPLNKDVLTIASERIKPFGNIYHVYGAAQKANHIPNSELYCSPFFCCFIRELWEMTGKATFEDIPGFDVGGYFSHKVKYSGNMMNLIYPTHCEVPMWDLVKPKEFGLGTSYGFQGTKESLIYHSFLSRQGNQQRFIDKCNAVINGSMQ